MLARKLSLDLELYIFIFPWPRVALEVNLFPPTQ